MRKQLDASILFSFIGASGTLQIWIGRNNNWGADRSQKERNSYWEQAALAAWTSYLVEQTGADGSSQVLGKENVTEDCCSQYQFETLEGKCLWVRQMKRQGSLSTGDKGQWLRVGRRTYLTLLQLEVSLAILVSSAWSNNSLLSLGVAINSCDKLCMCPVPPKVLKWELMNRCSQALWDLMSSERSHTGSLLSPVWHRNHSPCLCPGSGARALGSGYSRESLPDAAREAHSGAMDLDYGQSL